MQPFFAMIVPIGGGGNPPGIWGGSNEPFPGWGLPPAGTKPPSGSPPGTWGGSGQPFPNPPIPIYPGGTPNPPGTWGGSGEPFPGYGPPEGGPGSPPSIWPGRPAHPIVIPPEKPGDPPGLIWGGSNEPFPTPPIHLPPSSGEPPVGGPPVQIIDWKTAWTPDTGWIVVGVPQVPHPVPSAAAPPAKK